MDELQESLRGLLENPAELERLSQMASDLLGGAPEAEPTAPAAPPLPDLGALISRFQSGGQSDTQKLLQAMKPFLSRQRQEKLDRAMRAARLASVAQLALSRMEREEADEPILWEHGTP